MTYSVPHEFDFNLFRETLTGAVRQLAMSCTLKSVKDGVVTLTADEVAFPLVKAIGPKLKEQMGLYAPYSLVFSFYGKRGSPLDMEIRRSENEGPSGLFPYVEIDDDNQ